MREPESSRAPYGARGLKYNTECRFVKKNLSRPVWGAWIEIYMVAPPCLPPVWSRPVWGAWIEIITQTLVAQMAGGSRPVWGAWIEIA